MKVSRVEVDAGHAAAPARADLLVKQPGLARACHVVLVRPGALLSEKQPELALSECAYAVKQPVKARPSAFACRAPSHAGSAKAKVSAY